MKQVGSARLAFFDSTDAIPRQIHDFLYPPTASLACTMTRTIFFLFLLCFVVVPLTGCGGGSDNSVDRTPVVETAEEEEDRSKAEEREEAEEAAKERASGEQ